MSFRWMPFATLVPGLIYTRPWALKSARFAARPFAVYTMLYWLESTCQKILQQPWYTHLWHLTLIIAIIRCTGFQNTNLTVYKKGPAARIVCLVPKFDHITPTMMNLHWLPVKELVMFKILLIIYKALHGQAPQYICELLGCKRESRFSLTSVMSCYDVLCCFVIINIIMMIMLICSQL